MPDDATLAADGRARQPGTPIDERIPYYGTVEIVATPDPDSTPPHSATREMLEIDEPVTPWVFPFDFVIELARATFAPDPVTTAVLVLPERTAVPEPGTTPPGLSEFEARARAASTLR